MGPERLEPLPQYLSHRAHAIYIRPLNNSQVKSAPLWSFATTQDIFDTKLTDWSHWRRFAVNEWVPFHWSGHDASLEMSAHRHHCLLQHKFDFGCGFAIDTTRRAYNAPQTPSLGLRALLLGEGKGWRGRRGKEGRRLYSAPNISLKSATLFFLLPDCVNCLQKDITAGLAIPCTCIYVIL